MCKPTTCTTCNKTTWYGCAQHIPSVFASLPKDEWCVCTPKIEVGGVSYPPKVGTGSMPDVPGENVAGGSGEGGNEGEGGGSGEAKLEVEKEL